MAREDREGAQRLGAERALSLKKGFSSRQNTAKAIKTSPGNASVQGEGKYMRVAEK